MNIRLMKISASLKLKKNCWCLNPPISLKKVDAIETKYSFRLPSEYRDFITKIGNGGRIPSLNPQVSDEPCQLLPFQDSSALLNVELDFPLSESWEWDTDPNFSADTPEDEKKYFEVQSNGIIILANAGNEGDKHGFLLYLGHAREKFGSEMKVVYCDYQDARFGIG